MRVTVKLFGTLRRLSGKETPGLWQGEIRDDTTILELLGILGTVEAEVVAAAINGQPAALDAIVPPDGVVILVTPVNGG
jgi:sulfur carrier protein ThiS